jgi:hypothetical protein
MNCETFQTILPDLGRDYPLDLRTRQDGLAHAERCPNCSARLKDEYRLVAGLGTLAESFATAEASPKIEEALLKAFQTRTIKQQAEKQGETPRVMRARPSRPSANDSPLPPRAGTLGVDSRPSPGFWNSWPVRVAAISVLVMGLAAWFSWQTTGRKPEEVVGRLKPSLTEGISRVPPSEAWPTQTAIVPETTRVHSHEPKTSQRAARKVALQTARSQNSVKHSDSNEVEEYAALDQTEIATDFLPLSYEDTSSSSLEGGQLVRVQLPRTTLLSFGFPMSEERAPEPIKADVLFGADGMARAIRFVH